MYCRFLVLQLNLTVLSIQLLDSRILSEEKLNLNSKFTLLDQFSQREFQYKEYNLTSRYSSHSKKSPIQNSKLDARGESLLHLNMDISFIQEIYIAEKDFIVQTLYGEVKEQKILQFHQTECCIDKDCREQRTVCFTCMKNEKHCTHRDQVLNLEELKDYFNQNKIFVLVIMETINKLNTFCSILQDFLMENRLLPTFQLDILTTKEINNSIIKMNAISAFKSILSHKMQQLDIYLSEMINMSKCQGNNLVNIQIIQENNLITNYSPSQKFSLSDKHKNIEISEDETIAIGKLCKGIVICKPSIQGIKRFAFQILELGINEQISVGVSQKQNQDYSPDLTQIDHGCYMITNREVCYPHNNMEFNLITSNFTFGKNDLTIVQINNIHNKITFTKKYSL